ncbi:MAG: hemolysin III family protein [Clostridia bacterium]|nr:hemolysin III family protein [Clostridia bacterium]
MTRTCLKNRILPSYTKGEEIFNSVSHIVGGAWGIFTLVLCIIVAAAKGDAISMTCGIIFGVSMIALYTVSSIYHALPCGMAKKVFQVLDHCTIYFLIAGTYTPMLLCSLIKTAPLAAYITFGVVWGLAILSATLNAIDLAKYKAFSMIGYIGMGWAIIFNIGSMYRALGAAGFALLLGGGIMYTVGVLFYKIGSNKKYFHSVFHLFVLLGSILQSFSVIFYAL